MGDTRYWCQLAMEQFPPSSIVRQARAAERAGFDGVWLADHFQPWWEPGESGHAWVTLGAVGQATARIGLGSAVTAPTYRHNPAIVAQAFATLEELFPGRVVLGLGSGEALNEVPIGMAWPPVREQVDRLEEALDIIERLFDGERLDVDGRFFRMRGAYLHTRPRRRPERYVSAFGPRAARVAARYGDGIWTLAGLPDVDEIVATYRAARARLGRPVGEIVLHLGFSWAPDDDGALEGARVWKAAQPPEYYRDDWHDPRAMRAHAEREVSDEQLAQAFVISSDPAVHVERIRAVEAAGATIVSLQNASGAAPERALEVYGEAVLPALRPAPLPTPDHPLLHGARHAG